MLLQSQCALQRGRAPATHDHKKENHHEPLHFACHPASALIVGFILPSEEAAPQITAKDLEGTWTLVSITLSRTARRPISMVQTRNVNGRSTLRPLFGNHYSV
jgi:hypothetical protein